MKRVSARNEPKLSIVIPSFNQGEFIERTLDSVLSQEYRNLELIVIDGGSSDQTLSILERYDSHIAYRESKPDRGQAHALNKGFERATGDALGWQNADDLYVPGAFDRVVEAFEAHPGKSIVFGDYYYIDEDDEVLRRNYAFDFSLRHLIFDGFHLNAQATFWRREVHQRFGEFDEELHRTMDYEMLLRFGLTEGEEAFLRLDAPLASFRRHRGQKTQGFDEQVLDEHRRIARRWNTHRFDWPHRWLRPWYRARRAYWYLRRGGVGYVLRKGWKGISR